MQPYKSVKVGGGIGCKNFCQVSAGPLMKKLQGFIKVGFNRISLTLPSRSFTNAFSVSHDQKNILGEKTAGQSELRVTVDGVANVGGLARIQKPNGHVCSPTLLVRIWRLACIC